MIGLYCSCLFDLPGPWPSPVALDEAIFVARYWRSIRAAPGHPEIYWVRVSPVAGSSPASELAFVHALFEGRWSGRSSEELAALEDRPAAGRTCREFPNCQGLLAALVLLLAVLLQDRLVTSSNPRKSSAASHLQNVLRFHLVYLRLVQPQPFVVNDLQSS